MRLSANLDIQLRRPAAFQLPNAKRGFSLLELLVVIAVLLTLIAILVPTFRYARDEARATATRSTLGNIDLAIAAYRSDFVGAFPPGGTGHGGFSNPGTYGFNTLTMALAGWRGAARDGQDGPGFKLTSESRVYGPYYYTPSTFKRYQAPSDFPNPEAAANCIPAFRSEMYNSQNTPPFENAAYLDGWGSPIFYLPGNARFDHDSGGNTQRTNLAMTDLPATASTFNLMAPDVTDHTNTSTTTGAARYKIGGVDVYSRLVPYTPAGHWDVATTPRGLCWFANTASSAASSPLNPVVGLKFRQRIGQTDLTRDFLDPRAPLMGRNTYLLYSPGKDRLYYTGDDIISSGS